MSDNHAPTFVIPAKAGTQSGRGANLPWVPAFAGMTKFGMGEVASAASVAVVGAQDNVEHL
jgi:hypothetical protein